MVYNAFYVKQCGPRYFYTSTNYDLLQVPALLASCCLFCSINHQLVMTTRYMLRLSSFFSDFKYLNTLYIYSIISQMMPFHKCNLHRYSFHGSQLFHITHIQSPSAQANPSVFDKEFTYNFYLKELRNYFVHQQNHIEEQCDTTGSFLETHRDLE